MTSKHCIKCGTLKPFSEYWKRKSNKDDLEKTCSMCMAKKRLIYVKTKDGLTAKIYGNQRGKSRRYNMLPPDYTLIDLREWAFSQEKFYILYDNWVESGHKTELSPSFDRLNDYKSYTLDNLQLMTWSENDTKGKTNRKNGINNKVSKAVIQMTEGGIFIKQFHSSHQASREMSIHRSNISSCCRKQKGFKTAGGFKWKFATTEGGI